MTVEAPPEPLRYFEDFAVGTRSRFGPYTVTEDELVEFARQWDPQPFHIDPVAAAQSIYGGLIASGWHTAVITMRMLASNTPKVAGAGSPGLDELRWLAPVRAGTQLSGTSTVLEARRSASRPGIGVVRTRIETVDAERVPVLSYLSTFFVTTRLPADVGDGVTP